MGDKGKKPRPSAGVKLPPPFTIPAQQFTPLFSFHTALSQLTIGFGEPKCPPEPKGQPRTVVEVVGYRIYNLDQELYLIGQQGNKQEGRESPQGKHRQDDWTGVPTPNRHVCPGWDCLCGYSAMFWPMSLTKPGWNVVLAEVQAAGRTILCETGFRAERIFLNRLWVCCQIMPDSALDILRKRYEVPVEVMR